MPGGTRQRSGLLRIVIPLLTVSVILYAAAYWSLARPGLTIRLGRVISGPVYVSHRRVQNVLVNFFWPAHLIDRRLRPEMWQFELFDAPMRMGLPLNQRFGPAIDRGK